MEGLPSSHHIFESLAAGDEYKWMVISFSAHDSSNEIFSCFLCHDCDPHVLCLPIILDRSSDGYLSSILSSQFHPLCGWWQWIIIWNLPVQTRAETRPLVLTICAFFLSICSKHLFKQRVCFPPPLEILWLLFAVHGLKHIHLDNIMVSEFSLELISHIMNSMAHPLLSYSLFHFFLPS